MSIIKNVIVIRNKLRYLTKEEYDGWVERECITDRTKCSSCPFKNVPCNPQDDDCWINHKELYPDVLDQIIEYCIQDEAGILKFLKRKNKKRKEKD